MNNILVKLNSVGADVSDPLLISTNVGIPSPTSASKANLLSGLTVVVDPNATQIIITSTGVCETIYTMPITNLPVTTTTTTTAPPTTTTTTSTTALGTTTTTTTLPGTTTTTTTTEPGTTTTTTTTEPGTTTTTTTTEPPIIGNCYIYNIPDAELTNLGEDLYARFTDYGGTELITPYTSWDDTGEYQPDGIEVKWCAASEPVFRYGIAGGEFVAPGEWLVYNCTDCCDVSNDCIFNPPVVESFGRLYNFFVVENGGDNVANTGWHVPTYQEFRDLETYLGGSSVAGGELKETGLTNWYSPNTGATNSSGFSARGSGWRTGTGLFSSNKAYCILWSSDTEFITGNYLNGIGIGYNISYSTLHNMNPLLTKNKEGCSIRLIKDDSTWTVGDKYTGNDNQKYDTIKIGTQVWTLLNIKETKYRGGVDIPEVLDNTAWGALSTGARCYYVI